MVVGERERPEVPHAAVFGLVCVCGLGPPFSAALSCTLRFLVSQICQWSGGKNGCGAVACSDRRPLGQQHSALSGWMGPPRTSKGHRRGRVHVLRSHAREDETGGLRWKMGAYSFESWWPLPSVWCVSGVWRGYNAMVARYGRSEWGNKCRRGTKRFRCRFARTQGTRPVQDARAALQERSETDSGALGNAKYRLKYSRHTQKAQGPSRYTKSATGFLATDSGHIELVGEGPDKSNRCDVDGPCICDSQESAPRVARTTNEARETVVFCHRERRRIPHGSRSFCDLPVRTSSPSCHGESGDEHCAAK